MPNDIRTKAIVLRRTNYGESDRILNILTPEGKLSALAKGVRKEKSRLAGGIELFSVADIVVHQGRSNLGVLTSAKMLTFYSNIIADLSRLTFASECLKKTERAAEQTDNPDYFDILNQTLAGINYKYPLPLVTIWFQLNLAQAMGEEINLLTSTDGQPLCSSQTYFWDSIEQGLRPHPKGNIGATEIKLARLILSSKLSLVAHIKDMETALMALNAIGNTYNNM